MFKRYWRQFAAFVGLIAVGGLGYAGYNQLERYDAPAYADYKYQPARDAVPAPVPKNSKVAPPAYQPNCQTPKDRDDADLCAQWAAVQAVGESNRLARLSTYITGLEFGALVISLIFTGWAAFAAARAARSADKAIEATWDLGKPQAEADILVQSAWISMHAGGGGIATTFEAGIHWKNAGRSTARGARLEMQVSIFDAATKIYDQKAIPVSNVISPEVVSEAENNGHFALPHDVTILQNAVARMNADPWGHPLVAKVDAVVSYQSIFGDKIEKRFSLGGRLKGHANPPWGNINMTLTVESTEYLRNGKPM